jgi:hypothetical protein
VAAQSRAHTLGESYLYLQIYPDHISGRFEIALSDLNSALGFAGTDLEVTEQNLDERAGYLKNYYHQHVSISSDRGPVEIDFGPHGFLGSRGGFVLLPFEFGGIDGAPETLTIDYSILFDNEPGHRGFLLVEHNWATGTFANENQISLVFSPSSRRQDFDLTSSGRWLGFTAIVGLGMEHIWMGLDHVMFLIALLLPAVLRREHGEWSSVDSFAAAFWNVVKIVSAFTVAHSITLSLAALDLVRLPERLVEVAIAVSIAAAAAEILFPLFRQRTWLIVFGFGLFHGFGFAGALSEMGVLGENLGISLLAFNLGVEIGQIVIVTVAFPVLFMMRRLGLYRRLALPAAAVVMILISGAWIVERAFDIDIPMSETAQTLVEIVLPRD